jgi:hypothetical protein
MNWRGEPDFSILVGKTLTECIVGGDTIDFVCDNGERFQSYHDQNCCESVDVEDVIGDIADIVGSPILVAKEVANDLPPKTHEGTYSYTDESATWTFYKIDTAKGGVTIRWYGHSNGYYSESVYFKRLSEAHASTAQRGS